MGGARCQRTRNNRAGRARKASDSCRTWRECSGMKCASKKADWPMLGPWACGTPCARCGNFSCWSADSWAGCWASGRAAEKPGREGAHSDRSVPRYRTPYAIDAVNCGKLLNLLVAQIVLGQAPTQLERRYFQSAGHFRHLFSRCLRCAGSASLESKPAYRRLEHCGL